MASEVAVVIPTRNRARYLEVALESLASGRLGRRTRSSSSTMPLTDDTAAVAERLRRAGHPPADQQRGANAGRNAGDRADDRAADRIPRRRRPRAAELAVGAARRRRGATRTPRRSADRSAPASRGRRPAPAAASSRRSRRLDLGPARPRGADGVGREPRRPPHAPSSASGGFDEADRRPRRATRTGCTATRRTGCGRCSAAGGRIVYLADAAVEHRRVGDDARLRALARAAYHRGRYARISDERRGERARAAATRSGCWPGAPGTRCTTAARRA